MYGKHEDDLNSNHSSKTELQLNENFSYFSMFSYFVPFKQQITNFWKER